MNNPYRARPTRPRVDHTVGYGMPNQNVWSPGPRTQSEMTTNDNQAAITNQPAKPNSDPWNNSWNWDFDKQSEGQYQQQHGVPTYANPGQMIQNSAQDNFYQSINGNKSDLINQNSVSDQNTPGAIPGRQLTSNHTDPFYSNYVQNQQYPPPLPLTTASTQSDGINTEHPQWTNEQQSENMQRSLAQNRKDQLPQQPLAASNYNWGKTNQGPLPPQQTWQNYSNVQGPGQDPIEDKKVQQLDDLGNQCVPLLQQAQSPQVLTPPSEDSSKEHSINWSNNKQTSNDLNSWSNQSSTNAQWQNQKCDPVALNQTPLIQQPVQSLDPNNDFNSWSQQGNTDVTQQWQHTNDWPTQWWQQQAAEDPNGEQAIVPQENNSVNIAEDWQHNRESTSHYSLNTSAPTEPTIDRGVPPLSSKDAPPKSIKTQISDPFHVSTAENAMAHPSLETAPVQKSNDFNLSRNNSTDWGRIESLDELPAKLDQMSLNSKVSKQVENQNEAGEAYYPGPSEDSNQEPVSSFSRNKSRKCSVPDNIPILSSDYASSEVDNSHSNDMQVTVTQDILVHNTYQVAKAAETVGQAGYEHWYNQNTLPVSSENTCYSRDQGRQSKQWAGEQNVENYENIQQPSEFVNLEVVSPALQQRDIYGSRDSINKETLDNDPKPVVNPPKEAVSSRDFRQEVNNIEVPSVSQQQQQQQLRSHPPLQIPEQVPDNYEFASNDRNTFLETGELTDSHQEHEPTPPSQEDENDEVPNDIPFLREVPGQSSTVDPRRNDPTGQEQYMQSGQRHSDPRRNDPSGQEQSLQLRNIPDRTERRDVPPGQERSGPVLSRSDSDTLERRNDPSGRERSLPPQQSRNDPSGKERYQSQTQVMLEPTETREVPGRGNEPEESAQPTEENLRQIPGGASPSNIVQVADDRTNGRVVTGSQESAGGAVSDANSDSRSKREEAVGASTAEAQGGSAPVNRRDSYEDEEDVSSGNSRDDSRERRRDSSPERRRYEYERKNPYYDRDREYDDDYYYDRRRPGDPDRSYTAARDDFDRREMPYREDDRKHHSRDDLDRHPREEIDRRTRGKEDLDERDIRRRVDDRRRDRGDELRRRERDMRDYDPRYPRDRDYLDRDRRRDDRRPPRRYDDYDIRDPYRRDYYEDPYSRSSRPSSRSSYNDRDREYYVRSRDPYYSSYNGYPGYEYGAHYGNNYYAYLENLRRTNPAAYSEWYHKYYANQHQQQHMARGVTNYPEDRASVHSGRSSCDDRNTNDKRPLGDTSLLEDSASVSARMTPTKYSTSHTYGCFSIGSLIHVHPSYPADGERAKLDIIALDNLLAHEPVARDLRAYPGPLIKQVGVTHKKTIIEYCESKIKKAEGNEDMIDRASYILLYELMIMLIQQNGNVVGVDIAALLLRNKDTYPLDSLKSKAQDGGRRESVISQRSSATGGDITLQDSSTVSDKTEKPRKSVEQITDEFRNTLLHGLVQEALEYAMNEGLWGHALFLASKLDKRTHASVMTRFANSLPHHDPLQTLYQLHSGRIPSIVTSITDPRGDDWRPHLAMIISNTSANPEVNRRSITTLGDTLSSRGDIYAAHFCYILAQLDFGAYGASNVKLVLIGTNHHKPYGEFFTTEAVMLTEIYEYARNLCEPGFTLVDLQTFKFDLAMKMVDYGLIEKALLYIEQIAVNVTNEPSKYKKTFINAVYTLGDRIKYHDPIYKESTDDATALIWLSNLAEIVSKYQTGEITPTESHSSQSKADSHNVVQNQDVHEGKQQPQQWSTQSEYNEGPVSMMEVPSTEVQSDWQPLSLPSNIQDTYDQNSQYLRTTDESVQYQQPQQPDYWNQDSYYQNTYTRNECTPSNWQPQMSHTPYSSDQTDMDNTKPQDKWNYEPTQPAITMTSSTRKQYDPLEELDALETPKALSKSAPPAKKAAEKPAEKKSSNSSGSWFGGLFSKLAPKPRNQMILPDDSNPTIVWDPVAKKWINKDEDGESGSTAVAPPPKAVDMGFKPPALEQAPPATQPVPQIEDTAPPNPAKTANMAGGNMFKLPKGRSMRANYVDVMNPTGKSSGLSNIPTPVTSPIVPMATSSPQLFIPTPVHDTNAPVDFLTSSTSVAPSANTTENATQGLSRWSSTSSLSREVQSYTMRDPRLLPRSKGPMMYNPNELKDRSAKGVQPSRYPPR